MVHKPRPLLHAKAFLGRIDADIGLLQVATVFRQSPLRVTDWKRGELRRWSLDQLKEITGTASLEDAIRNPDVLTLLAVGYMAVEHVSDFTPPTKPSAPTPRLLKALERGFLKALLEETKTQTRLSPTFAERLTVAEQRVARLIRSLAVAPLQGPSQLAPSAGGTTLVAAAANNSGWGVIGLLAIICAVAWVVGKLTKKKKN